ncbi:glutamyl-tRNA reductase [Aureibacillus halotolerans]|uniref:Glutamyl-tRNA reductase n=1 Tax=Aureibacillus halotolerans TaxID=1508390 RepID=A0A4R6TYL1_9BACI|nr:glutamyl-tRNA reductase [Aureibacillus halotolerans]TDQ37942.1 glutamyl-tRNA reductase [Aureibacillus halotolerans]
MHIIAMSMNYKTVPVEFRERVSFDKESMPEALHTLREAKSILENVIVSTCNRTEIYVVADQVHTGRYYMRSFLAKWFDISLGEVEEGVTYFEDDDAIQHLFEVSCGLDSMVLGETQILGQIKDSFLIAQREQTTGTLFNQLFKQAITLAKRAHAETTIGESAVSVGYAAVELGKKIFGSLEGKHVLIVGAGKMSELAAKNLEGQGVASVSVMNRTYERAKELADRFDGDAMTFDGALDALAKADILISSTNASRYIITKDMVQAVEKKRKGKPFFLIDIAVPRDLDPAIHELDHMFLYDIDDLEGIVESNLEERKKQAENIRTMLVAEKRSFQEWLNTLGVVPMITSLREKALDIQSETMKSIERKMPDLTDRERKILNKHTKSIVNQLLKGPITKAKELAGESGSEDALKMFAEMFDLTETETAKEDTQKVFVSVADDDASERKWNRATAGT